MTIILCNYVPLFQRNFNFHVRMLTCQSTSTHMNVHVLRLLLLVIFKFGLRYQDSPMHVPFMHIQESRTSVPQI